MWEAIKAFFSVCSFIHLFVWSSTSDKDLYRCWPTKLAIIFVRILTLCHCSLNHEHACWNCSHLVRSFDGFLLPFFWQFVQTNNRFYWNIATFLRCTNKGKKLVRNLLQPFILFTMKNAFLFWRREANKKKTVSGQWRQKSHSSCS